MARETPVITDHLLTKTTVIRRYWGVEPGILAMRSDGAVLVGDDDTPAVWLPPPAAAILEDIECRRIARVAEQIAPVDVNRAKRIAQAYADIWPNSKA